ncbi:MAG: hypothetical protein JSU68_11875 [Phycisphaerales bacterium]|nr:MAG: hypothetical protein JSU68_11875 [Phycisphaerales bacterium]
MKHLVPGFVLIVLAVAVLQGPSVRYPLMLDDYSHRAGLREGDFSLRSLVDASHLGGHGQRVEMWWQRDADLYFFRPVAFALMRAVYVVGGWRPEVMHVFSLVLSVTCGTLVMVLARQVTGSARWATLAGLLFVMHPGPFLAVRWIACQNEQMATAFVLAGLLAYGRYSGWYRPDSGEGAAGGRPYLVAALTLFVLALGCRESSVIFGFMVLLGDLLCRPARMRGRWAVYLTLALITAGYMVFRHVVLGETVLPGRPYAYPPGTPGFWRFIADKLVYYMLALFVYVPIVGFGGLHYLRAHPLLFYGSFSLLVVVGLAVVTLLRDRRRMIWFWVGVALLPLAPVLPVFASSHHLYMATAGMMIAAVLVWQGLLGWAARRRILGAVVGGSVAVIVAVHVVAFAGANVAYGTAVASFSASSRLPVEDVARLGDALQPNDRLFFVNLPMLGFNCIPGIEEETGVAPLHGYVLTFAPAFLGMDRPSRIDRVGERQLRVRLDRGGYFEGLAGASMLEAVGQNDMFAEGRTFTAADFEVEVLRADSEGLQELLFTFERPLDDPAYHFFVGSRLFQAYPLRFR